MRSILILAVLAFSVLIGSSDILYSQTTGMEYASSKQKIASQEEFKKGYYYYNNMAYEAAISFFRSAISINPKNDLALYWLGRAYYMAGYDDIAIITWETLLKDSQNTQGLFLQQELEKLYVDGFRSYLVPENSINFSFLRFLDTKTNPSYMTTDSNNNLYVSDFYKNQIKIYDPNFKQIKMLTEGIKQPVNLFIYNNLLFVSSFGNNTIRVYDINNQYKFLYDFGGFGFKEGQLAGPVGLAVYKDRLYVVDQGNNRIQIFQTVPKPYFIGQFGKLGKGSSEFNVPSGIAVYKEQVWVLDSKNRRIQVFDLEGNYIKQITSNLLSFPIQAFVFQNQLYIADQDTGIFVLKDDKVHLIQSPTQGIQRISNAWIDNNGILFVSDISNPSAVAYTEDTKKISSLNLRTLFLTTSAYPKIIMKLKIKDANKIDIKGLNADNIQVTQDGYKMNDVSLQPLIPKNKKVSLSVIIRDSLDMEKYHNQILSYISRIVDLKSEDDQVSITMYNSQQQVTLSYTTSALRIKDNLENYNWNTSNHLVDDDKLDEVLYKSIDSNEFNDSYNAILLIDNNTESSFKKYSEEVIAKHSERVGVPIYVVNLEANPNSTKERSLKFLAQKSGGKYFIFDESNKIFDIFNLIKENSPLFYILSYTTPVSDTMLNAYWANVVLTLDYKHLYGVDQLGYMVN